MIESNFEMTNNIKFAFWLLSIIQLPVPIVLFIFKFMKSKNDLNGFENEDICSNEKNNSTKNRDDYSDLIDMQEENKKSFFEKLKQFPPKAWDYLCKYFDNSLTVFKMTFAIAFMVFLFDGLQVLVK